MAKKDNKKQKTKKDQADKRKPESDRPQPVPEVGGRGGLDPARYGDWEIGGRCVDF